MEPNKIDTQIKDKLNNRTITPSASSWDRLDAMLNSTEKKKTNQKIQLDSSCRINSSVFGFRNFLHYNTNI